MFGFFRSAMRPFASLGSKIGEFFGLGRKVSRGFVGVEPIIESRPVAKSFAETFDAEKNISAGWQRKYGGKLNPTADDLWLMPSAQFDPETKGFYGIVGEGV